MILAQSYDEVYRSWSRDRIVRELLLLATDVLEESTKSNLDTAVKKLDNTSKEDFDGGPLRIVRTKNGFKVYSRGPDTKDDGGPNEPGYLKRVPDIDDIGIWLVVN